MAKRKRKRSAEEKAARDRRRQEYETVFINGKMKRIRRPPTVDGMSVDDFLRANADPIVLHQEGLWEYLETDDDPDSDSPRVSAMTPSARERVSFITTEKGADLIVAYAIDVADGDEVVSLILQRTPKFERLLPPEDRGVTVSHELFPDEDRELAKRIIVDGPHVDIETTVRTYRVDVSAVDPEEIADARKVLRRMHRVGGFSLEFR